jgi:dTDP-4-dehydrorhamnose reductase
LTDSGSTTWHGIAGAILEDAERMSLLQRRPRLRAISTADYPTRAARPRNSQLCCDRLTKAFGIALPAWKQGIALCLQEIKSRPPCTAL